MKLDEVYGLKHNSDETCISVILPAWVTVPDIKLNRTDVKNALNEVAKQLEYHNGREQLLDKLKKVAERIDYDHPAEGVGLFVSDSAQKLIRFDHPVKRKVVIGETFDVREIIREVDNAIYYLVLQLSKKKIRLFSGSGHTLEEVTDKAFPKELDDTFEYPRSHEAGLSHHGLRSTVEKSSTIENRLETFFRSVDKALDKYLTPELPLFIMGMDKHLSLFLKISAHSGQVAAQISGSYEKASLKDLSALVYPEVEKYLEKKTALMIGALNEENGKGRAAFGLEEVWKAAHEGKVRIMLVEKDHTAGGYKSKDGSRLYLTSPNGQSEPYHAPMAVDEIIEMVLRKGGQVLFAENGSLGKYGHMACLLRY